ncbi:MAG: NAD(P)-dependent oxidoreductase [Geminicoccaceae bacterium]
MTAGRTDAPRTPHVVIAEIKFRPEHREALIEAARLHARSSLAEVGCLRFEVVIPRDAEDRLVFVETFADEAAFHLHQASPHVARWRAASADFITDRRVREMSPLEPVSRGTILVSVPALARHKDYLTPLADAGFELRFNDLGRVMREAELIERLDGVLATIASIEPYTERVLAAAPRLEVIARLGVGYDQIDVSAATRHGVAVAMAFGTNHEAVADHAFALMGALAHRIRDYDERVRKGGWGSLFHGRLQGTTVGLVGFGRIGRAMAKRAQGFAMEVLVADPFADASTVAHLGCRLVELDELLQTSDFVSIHAPLSPETHHLIGAERLALMKPTAFVVNTSRGGLIDEDALIAALESGKIAGAGLDVFEHEPLPDTPLRRLSNVVLTPHVAGLSAWTLRTMAEKCVENILAVVNARDPGDGLVLNPEVLSTRGGT